MKNENELIKFSCSLIEVIRIQRVIECQFRLVQTVVLKVTRWSLTYMHNDENLFNCSNIGKKKRIVTVWKKCTKISKNLSNDIINLARNPRKDLKKNILFLIRNSVVQYLAPYCEEWYDLGILWMTQLCLTYQNIFYWNLIRTISQNME
jgi:hypothetical protein